MRRLHTTDSRTMVRLAHADYSLPTHRDGSHSGGGRTRFQARAAAPHDDARELERRDDASGWVVTERATLRGLDVLDELDEHLSLGLGRVGHADLGSLQQLEQAGPAVDERGQLRRAHPLRPPEQELLDEHDDRR